MADDLLKWLWCLALVTSATATSICDVTGCNCTTQHKYWQIVNCTLDNNQILEVSGGMVPIKTIELSVSGPGSSSELILLAGAFTNLQNLQRVLVVSIAALQVRRHAFQAAGGVSIILQVQQCDALRLETDAFRDMRAPLKLYVTRSSYVTVQKRCFGFLEEAKFSEIPRLELSEEAFTFDSRDLGHHGAVTTIQFNRVMIPSLGRDVFKSSLAEVSVEESEIREVAGGAFSGNTIAAVHIVNSSLHRVRGSAFSERTQLDNLIFTRCKLHHFDSNAILGAVTNLTFQYSNITTLSAGAVNAIVARLIFQYNWVEALRRGGLTVRDWSRVSIDHNVFGKVSERALDLAESVDSSGDLSFINNILRLSDTGALSALASASRPRIYNNHFGHPCHCDIKKWLQDLVTNNLTEMVAQYNFCSIDQIMSQCYELNETVMLIKNFTDSYCGNDGSVIECKTFLADANVGSEAGLSIGDDNGELVFGLVVGLVLFLAVIGTSVILLVHGGLWLKRKGYCVHYRTQEQSSTEVEDMVPVQENVSGDLPEELTQDLLQMLRDKLEDPNSYHEAREMIERLYDHFIIEESYTNNNRHDEETHLYEELGALGAQTASNAPVAENKDTNGPFSFLRLIEERFGLNTTNNTTLAAEYSEPTDAEVHLYSELPPRHKEDRQNEINEELQARTPSPAYLASRPLPSAPGRAGPSTQP